MAPRKIPTVEIISVVPPRTPLATASNCSPWFTSNAWRLVEAASQVSYKGSPTMGQLFTDSSGGVIFRVPFCHSLIRSPPCSISDRVNYTIGTPSSNKQAQEISEPVKPLLQLSDVRIFKWSGYSVTARIRAQSMRVAKGEKIRAQIQKTPNARTSRSTACIKSWEMRFFNNSYWSSTNKFLASLFECVLCLETYWITTVGLRFRMRR